MKVRINIDQTLQISGYFNLFQVFRELQLWPLRFTYVHMLRKGINHCFQHWLLIATLDCQGWMQHNSSFIDRNYEQLKYRIYTCDTHLQIFTYYLRSWELKWCISSIIQIPGQYMRPAQNKLILQNIWNGWKLTTHTDLNTFSITLKNVNKE